MAITNDRYSLIDVLDDSGHQVWSPIGELTEGPILESLLEDDLHDVQVQTVFSVPENLEVPWEFVLDPVSDAAVLLVTLGIREIDLFCIDVAVVVGEESPGPSRHISP